MLTGFVAPVFSAPLAPDSVSVPPLMFTPPVMVLAAVSVSDPPDALELITRQCSGAGDAADGAGERGMLPLMSNVPPPSLNVMVRAEGRTSSWRTVVRRRRIPATCR